MLQKLEMYEIQDKARLLDEMNETREAVNRLEKKIAALTRMPKPMPKSKVTK